MGDADDHSLDRLQALCKFHHAERTKIQRTEGLRRKSRRRAPEKHPGMR